MSDSSDLDAPTVVGSESTAALPPTWPTIEGYELIRELGQGGMGTVYLARDESLERLVALKTIDSKDSKLAKILVHEARIAGKLEHPVIVPVYAVNTSTSPWYFSMGFVEGEDLSRLLSRQVLLPDEVVDLGIAICQGLQHAHDSGILHLDIKPANILLDRQHRPKLTDFGLSAVHASKAKGRYGTPQFMSPEQALGDQPDLSAASDVYSLEQSCFPPCLDDLPSYRRILKTCC